MATLTALYIVLFCFIRIQSKNLLKGTSSTEHKSHSQSTHELQTWEANLESGKGDQTLAASQILTTRTVTVNTEERLHHSSPMQSYRRMKKVSITLLIYPLLYFFLTMPLAVSRIAEFTGKEWGLTFAYVGAAIFDCSGLANVLLYTTTRKGIITWSCFKRRQSPAPPEFTPRDVRTHNDLRPTPSSKCLASSVTSLSNNIAHPKPVSDSDSELEQRV